jgi:hypothetical protein
VLWHSRRVPKFRSRFGDQDFTKRRGSSHALDEKASAVIAGLDPAIHLLTKVDGYAVILREDALRAFARV